MLGWQCCKPRVLTFDEFLSIPPCTAGKHSAIDDTQYTNASELPKAQDDLPPTLPPKPMTIDNLIKSPMVSHIPQASAPPTAPSAFSESDSDDPSRPIQLNTTCRRRGCNSAATPATMASRGGEQCMYHPGKAIFHEGSKGWTCCNRRVLEFDQFMKIAGCKQKSKHLFVGSKKGEEREEKVMEVRCVGFNAK